MDLDEFTTAIKDMIGEYTPESPEADWDPVVFVHDAENRIGIVGIDPEFLASPLNKKALSVSIVQVLREAGAQLAAFVSSAWLVHVETPKEERRRPLSHSDLGLPESLEHVPGRREVVAISVASRDTVAMWQAEIVRTNDQSPMLADWEFCGSTAEGEEVGMDGLFADALRMGING